MSEPTLADVLARLQAVEAQANGYKAENEQLRAQVEELQTNPDTSPGSSAVSDSRYDALISRVQSLELEATEAQKLKAENEQLRHQIDQTNPRLTPEQARKRAEDILDKSRLPKRKGKYLWTFREIVPGQVDRDGKPALMAHVYSWRTNHKDKASMLAEFGVATGIIYSPESIQAYPQGFVPEGYEAKEEKAKEEPAIVV